MREEHDRVSRSKFGRKMPCSRVYLRFHPVIRSTYDISDVVVTVRSRMV